MKQPYAFCIPYAVMFIFTFINSTGLCGAAEHPSVASPQSMNLLLIGERDSSLSSHGNQTDGLQAFLSSREVVFRMIMNTPHKDGLKYRLAVYDHYVNAGIVFDQTQERMAVSGGGEGFCDWTLPQLMPGFYYAVCSVIENEAVVKSGMLTFAIDLNAYRLTPNLPADFNDFWKHQDELLKKTAPNPILKLLSSENSPNKTFELVMDLPAGHKVRALLFVPEKIGLGPTVLSSIGSVDSVAQDALKPGFHPAKNLPWCPSMLESSIHLLIALDEASSFTKWQSAGENDLLQCIQGYLRGIDYLVSRPDVNPKNIFVSGASRGGPLAVAVAARRPDSVSGVAITIPTSVGCSLQQKPYRGWGMMQREEISYPAGPFECLFPPLKNIPVDYIEQFTAMNCYVDPLNFAQDLRAPIAISYTINDPLSPPQGIEALYSSCGSSWKRISRDIGDHHVSGGFLMVQDELVKYLLQRSNPQKAE